MIESFRDILEELMDENNLSITDLSNNLQMDYKQLSNYVKGVYAPSLKSALKLADYFQCSLDYLCGLVETKSVNNYLQPDFLFYERYKKLLDERKITHYKLTKDCGINVNDSRLWKQGKVPTLITLYKIADYLSVSIDFLIGRKVINSTL